MKRPVREKICIAVTGASGSVYAQSVLEKLQHFQASGLDVAAVFSETARKVWKYETGHDSWNSFPYHYYDNDDFFAPVASGSAGFRTMIIIPCSMGALGRIASGHAGDLISRAADVVLKERGTLVLAIREAPYNLIHIENMRTITLAGGIIFPASPSFYHKPARIEDLISNVTDRVLELAGLPVNPYRWGEVSGT